MNGWIILDKPLGLSSSQAVGAVKRILRQNDYGRPKVGHGGTLDPLATGVLPIALGEATKLTGRMLDADKGYDFTIGFGVETDTLDGEGQAIATSDIRPTLAAVEAVLPQFTGRIEQMPPAYSALKVDGRRAYDLARAGEAVALKARGVEIYSLTLNSSPQRGGEPAKPVEGFGPGSPLHHPARSGEDRACITLSVRCSKGTYVRSLARDIAHALGTVGHVTMLRRTKAGPFTLDQAIPLDRLEEIGQGRALEQVLLPMTAGLDDIPALALTPGQAGQLRMGRQLAGIVANQGLHLATDGPVPVALVEVSDGNVRVVRGFNL